MCCLHKPVKHSFEMVVSAISKRIAKDWPTATSGSWSVPMKN